MGKLRTTKRPVGLYEATLAVSEVSGVTIVCSVAWAGVAEVLACDGFFEAHPAANIAASNNVNGVSHFIATVNRVASRRSIHDSGIIASL
jgi:hypothetical protein